jgi:tetratricopeptide (TPR) repeat protein
MSHRPKKKLPPDHRDPGSRKGAASETAGRRSSRRDPFLSMPGFWTRDAHMAAAACGLLLMAVVLVFGQTLRHEFVNNDDDRYVYENPIVQKGLSLDGVRWALTYGEIGHWHPLTWLSHMLDCQIYGMNAGGHHLTNVLLHAASVILLFLVLWRMTGFVWRSAFVAAVFAVHPLRAESVAWVAERKDVLSGLFFMLTLGAYVRSVRRPASMARYLTVVLFFALGLLSKNMLVTLPFILMLLDYWPLNRASRFTPQVLFRLVIEKWPLFALTAASCAITFLVPEEVSLSDKLPLAVRLENAVVSYVIYLLKMIYPSGLACLYPNPAGHLPFWQVAGALGLLLAVSGTIFAFRRKHPYLIVGWLWYLGMMLPVIGIVQISFYSHADRYTYLPQIGLSLLLTWMAADLFTGRRFRLYVLGGSSVIIVSALMYAAAVQTSYWRNSESLWSHALACTTRNYIAENSLGGALVGHGKINEAMIHFHKAFELKPDYPKAPYNIGIVLMDRGQVDEAIAYFQRALEIDPDYADAHNNLGIALAGRGRVDEAIAHYRKALEINIDYADVYNNLGIALAGRGQVDEAIVLYRKALEFKPDFAKAHNSLGIAFASRGQVDQAIVHFQKALEIQPDYARARYHLDLLLRQQRQPE